MWKYGFRRIKDTIDKTYCNVLDVKKTWTCSKFDNSESCTGTGSPFASKSVCELKSAPDCRGYGARFKDRKSSSNDDEEFKEKVRRKCHAHSLIGALTWSSAIICGWYASQLLCLNRRNVGWETRCNFHKAVNTPSRAIHSNILTHRALASPPTPVTHTKYFYDEDSNDSIDHDHVRRRNEQILLDFSSVGNVDKERTSSLSSSTSSTSSTIDAAVKDLLSVLGDIEFSMGLQNIEAGNFATAVSHLKLATSHNHPGATFNLGLCYERGLGVDKDLRIAQECYQIAASLGHSKAMYNLGVFYAHGLGGLKKNRRAARACFNSAAHLGQEEAISALNLRKSSSSSSSSSYSDSSSSFSPVPMQKPSHLLQSAMKLHTIACQ